MVRGPVDGGIRARAVASGYGRPAASARRRARSRRFSPNVARLFNRQRVFSIPAQPWRVRAVWLFWIVVIVAVLVADVILVACLIAVR